MAIATEWLRGCATALVTPFKRDGSLDEERMRSLVERQIAGGVSLLVPCGTTGESATMTEEEDRRVIGLTIEVAREKGARVKPELEATQPQPRLNTRVRRVTRARMQCLS